MCRWMGSHFHDWNDYYVVTFSIELLEWSRIFSDFWVKIVLHIYGLANTLDCFCCRWKVIKTVLHLI